MTDKPTPTDAELDRLIATYLKRLYPQDNQPHFERAIMRAVLAKWGQPARSKTVIHQFRKQHCADWYDGRAECAGRGSGEGG